jgi:hypothetical protein
VSFLLQLGRPDKDTIRGDAASKPTQKFMIVPRPEHGRISDGPARLLGLAPFAFREAMTWEYALAGCVLTIGGCGCSVRAAPGLSVVPKKL